MFVVTHALWRTADSANGDWLRSKSEHFAPYFDRKAQHMLFAPFRTQSLRHTPHVARAVAVQLLLKSFHSTEAV